MGCSCSSSTSAVSSDDLMTAGAEVAGAVLIAATLGDAAPEKQEDKRGMRVASWLAACGVGSEGPGGTALQGATSWFPHDGQRGVDREELRQALAWLEIA